MEFDGLGPALRMLRLRRGLNATQLADLLGVRRQYVTGFETGNGLSVQKLGRILEVLDSNLLELQRAMQLARHFGLHPTEGEVTSRGRRAEAAVATSDGLELAADADQLSQEAQQWLARFEAAWERAQPPVAVAQISPEAERALHALGLHTLVRRKRQLLLTILQSLLILFRPKGNPAPRPR